ncbi:MAG: type II glyceraldehyde-3-phosphate dehydrogenase [Euryarchaeota archaeon]|nr:type II glyceraldehyde-3-phosphate dehydrogenase [Euryarchaeota archaeon]
MKIGVVGYGTIGKRIIDASIALGFDTAIAVRRYTPKLDIPIEMGYPLYSMAGDIGLKIHGDFYDFVQECDLIADCTPKGIPEKNFPQYDDTNVIVQGGERHALTDFSFSSLGNYKEGVNKDRARVVSCNTTSLVRTLSPLKEYSDNVFVTLVRRATDPWDAKKGPINAITPVLKVPSHHGPDLNTVLPDIDIRTMAVKVPTTLAHLHTVRVELKEGLTIEEIKEIFWNTPRIALMKGYSSTADVMEHFRDLGRKRYDMYETMIFEESINVSNGVAYWIHMVHQESIVIPENMDCIKAMFGEKDKWKAIYETDKALGIEKKKKCYK